MQAKDLTGNTYSMITVLEEVFTKSKKAYKCRCECGVEFTKTYANLTAKRSDRQSCGCMKSQWASDKKITHGRRIGGKSDPLRKPKTRLQRIWSGMKSRCVNSDTFFDCPGHSGYKERGTSLHEDWLVFATFETWALANGYSDELSIDRRNNDGNYEPDNCRWATQSVQGQNTKLLSKSNKSGYRGVSYTGRKSPWRAMVYLNNKAVYNKSFPTAIEAARARDKYVIDNNLEHTLNF